MLICPRSVIGSRWMLRLVALRGQHGGAKRYATDALRSCWVALSSEPKGPMGTHTLANMALLLRYSPLQSSARTRHRAAYITAASALSRCSCVQRGRIWSRKTSVACCVITELLRVDRSVRPKGAKGDSPGQSEAPPWVRLRDGSIGSLALGDPFGPNFGGFRGL